MPGTPGGGHSGSFGGGHSGGSHSGSFGSHSGSFGSHSSSFGSHSSSHSSFSHTTRSGGSSGGIHMTPMFIGGGRGAGSGCVSGRGCLPALAVFMIVPVVFFVISVALALIGGNGSGTKQSRTVFNGGTESYAEERQTLAPEYCTPQNINVDDVTGTLKNTDVTEIESAINYFYVKTGVQPFFMLRDGIDGVTFPDDETVYDFLKDKYVELFGEDEGHLLLLILADDTGYSSYHIPGSDAETVTDKYICEDLLAKIDGVLDGGDKSSIASAVSAALTETADEYFTVKMITEDETGTNYDVTEIDPDELEDLIDGDNNPDQETDLFETLFKAAFTFVFVAVAAGIIFTVIRVLKQQKKTAEAMKHTDYKQAEPPESSLFGTYGPQAPPAGYVQVNRPTGFSGPVTCPHCGAFDYPKEDGTCKYCDKPIK